MFSNFGRRFHRTFFNKNCNFNPHQYVLPIIGASTATMISIPLFASTIAIAEDSKMERNDMNTLIFGSGEYVTGYTSSGTAAKSDKSMGVVGLVMFDLRERGLIGDRIGICGTNGDKFDGIRKHWNNTIKKIFYNSFPSDNSISFEQFPKKGIRDYSAYKTALKEFSKPGDICIIFTPDDTHFDIANEAIDNGLHVLCTKPFVKSLDEHLYLIKKAKEKGVLLQLEVHKRYDPMYEDAINRIKDLGEFNYFTSYMSQPSHQLMTFKSWAGISSDISYYLNSHHIDLHVAAMQNKAKCVKVNAYSSDNVVATKLLNDGRKCEDTITICAQWQDLKNPQSTGHAVYTSSWSAIKADVHSQQRFFCLMEKGEINIDQAHRGYTLAVDTQDTKSGALSTFNNVNPLFIRNKPDNNGHYVSQNCYGYITFEKFVKAAKLINDGKNKPEDFDDELPTGNVTALMTAILEAGRISLDNDNKAVLLKYDDNDQVVGLKLDDDNFSFVEPLVLSKKRKNKASDGKYLIIDVRNPSELDNNYNLGNNVNGNRDWINIPKNSILNVKNKEGFEKLLSKNGINDVSKYNDLYFMCALGGRSKMAVDHVAKNLNLEQTLYNVNGGITRYDKDVGL